MFDDTARGVGANAQWSLIDPFGGSVFDSGFSGTASDVGPLTVSSTGTYTLMIEGSRFDSSARSEERRVGIGNSLHSVAVVYVRSASATIDAQGENEGSTF